MSEEPAVIQTVVVSAVDLVAALEASYRRDNVETVLRATPPFSGRMRARLHVESESTDTDPETVCFPPRPLVADDCPVPPDPDDVEDALRADPTETYTVDRHKRRYQRALEEWRRTIPDYAVDETQLPETGRDVTFSDSGPFQRNESLRGRSGRWEMDDRPWRGTGRATTMKCLHRFKPVVKDYSRSLMR